MTISPLAGKPAPKYLLVDLTRLEREYYACRTDLDHRGLDLGLYPLAEHGLGHRPVQRGAGRRRAAQRDGLVEQRPGATFSLPGL